MDNFTHGGNLREIVDKYNINESKIVDFGYFSAKFDDILNFLPARLTAVVSGILSFVVGGKVKETFSVIILYLLFSYI